MEPPIWTMTGQVREAERHVDLLSSDSDGCREAPERPSGLTERSGRRAPAVGFGGQVEGPRLRSERPTVVIARAGRFFFFHLFFQVLVTVWYAATTMRRCQWS